jgi:hypothetical protein
MPSQNPRNFFNRNRDKAGMRRTVKIFAAVMISSVALPGVALAASRPSVYTGGTSSVSDTSATLRGSVNPHGNATSYYFQWGRTVSYGTDSGTRSAGNGTSYVAVTTGAGDLSPGTTYHFRLVASNSSGTRYGADRTFTTHGASSDVSTGPVTDLYSNGAVLTGSINPSGARTSWYFQWGTEGTMSNETPVQTLSSTSSPQEVAWSLENQLSPATVYQYRLVVVHPMGARTYGATELFMTYPTSRPYAGVHAITYPRNRVRYPYTFTTTGTVSGPSWIPAQFACIGDVTLRFYDSTRQVRFEEVPVQSNCTFSETTVFTHLPYGTHAPVNLKVFVHFQSTGYLANGRPAHDRMTIR